MTDHSGGSKKADIVCFSHLRWDFVYQRPQHLMSRFARHRRVFFFEEPVRGPGPARIVMTADKSGVCRVAPHLADDLPAADEPAALQTLLDQMTVEEGIHRPVAWYYTPMALKFSRHLPARAVIYDCMDELSAFRFAPPELAALEQELLDRADVVFTGGQSLYEAKRHRHANIHPFPSGVDVPHFKTARCLEAAPPEQMMIGTPRLGFYGVIDERLDLELIRAVAERRPSWQIVLVGPVVKIDPAELPRLPNIHYLGVRPYEDLPAYLAGWDVALLPFARNESTRFISPTKTPEYLAGGKPVVSTPITDVVRPYGEQGLVWIAETPEAFIRSVEAALNLNGNKAAWLEKVDAFLKANSWDDTYRRMAALVDARSR